MKKQQFLGVSLHTGLKVKYITDRIQPYSSVKYEAEFECGRYIPIESNPILRPLSALIKPITHNGETFVPIAKLFKMPDSEVDIVSASEECVQFINKRTRCHYSFYVATIRLTEALKLIEWHFNLMDESEPFIPVTDEFNPYK